MVDEKIKRPSVYIAMPCYDSVKINTMISMVKLIAALTKAQIQVDVNTMKSPYVAYARNILTGRFMASDKDYLLFVDADVEFEPVSYTHIRAHETPEHLVCRRLD